MALFLFFNVDAQYLSLAPYTWTLNSLLPKSSIQSQASTFKFAQLNAAAHIVGLSCSEIRTCVCTGKPKSHRVIHLIKIHLKNISRIKCISSLSYIYYLISSTMFFITFSQTIILINLYNLS